MLCSIICVIIGLLIVDITLLGVVAIVFVFFIFFDAFFDLVNIDRVGERNFLGIFDPFYNHRTVRHFPVPWESFVGKRAVSSISASGSDKGERLAWDHAETLWERESLSVRDQPPFLGQITAVSLGVW